MCGGFLIYTQMRELAYRFKAEAPASEFSPRYNARPSQNLPVILDTNPEQIEFKQWGIVPPWSKSQRIINTRKESLDTKPFFKKAFHTQRCIVLTNGFYEWKGDTGHKVPFRFSLKNDEPFAFAGIWMENKKTNEPNFTIITVEPNTVVSQIHNRMPAILPLQQEKDWLNPDLSEKQALEMLFPFPEKQMVMHEASTRVNSVKFDAPDALSPNPSLNL